jgi:hypothetical protein
VDRNNEFTVYAGKLMSVSAWTKLFHCGRSGHRWVGIDTHSPCVLSAASTSQTKGPAKKTDSVMSNR